MKSNYLTPTQLAKALGISRQAVVERIKKGHIAATKVGQQYIIDRKVLSSVKTEGDPRIRKSAYLRPSGVIR